MEFHTIRVKGSEADSNSRNTFNRLAKLIRSKTHYWQTEKEVTPPQSHHKYK